MIGNLSPQAKYILEHLKKGHTCRLITDRDKILLDNTFIENSIKEFKPNLILHAANIEDVDYCEEHEDEAFKVNTVSTLNISKISSKLNIPLVYFSSSFVFDGNSEKLYTEKDRPNPINVYGKTKANSEEIIQSLCKKYFIIRTSFCYGDSDCLIKKIINNPASLFYSADYVINPTYIEDLALSLDKLINSTEYGIYHCASKGYATKLDFTKFVLNEVNRNCIVQALPTDLKNLCAIRPNFTALSNELLSQKFNIEFKDWKVKAKEYISSLS